MNLLNVYFKTKCVIFDSFCFPKMLGWILYCRKAVETGSYIFLIIGPFFVRNFTISGEKKALKASIVRVSFTVDYVLVSTRCIFSLQVGFPDSEVLLALQVISLASPFLHLNFNCISLRVLATVKRISFFCFFVWEASMLTFQNL